MRKWGAYAVGLLLGLTAGNDTALAQTCAAGGAPRLEAAGLCLRWTQQLSEADLGRPADQNILYGPAGMISSPSPADQEYRFVGRAPDGQLAIQMNVPAGAVPGALTVARNFAPEEHVTHAGYAVDMWIPESFEFAPSCADSNYLPGTGRWPFGLWIGDDFRYIADGTRPTEQTGISIRPNRKSRSTGQDATIGLYIYNLNRASPECELTGVCAVDCSISTPGACYGYSPLARPTTTPRGRWVRIESTVRQNDPAQVNGEVGLWMDGRPLQYITGLDLGRDRNWFIRGFYSFELWHCQPSPKAQKYWFRNLRLYSE